MIGDTFQSVVNWWSTHRGPFMRPDLPVALIAPRSIGRHYHFHYPIELLELPLPTPEFPIHPFNPQADEVKQLPPAVRCLVEYVRGVIRGPV